MHILWSCSAISDVWTEKESPMHKWLSNEADVIRMWKNMTRVSKNDQ